MGPSQAPPYLRLPGPQDPPRAAAPPQGSSSTLRKTAKQQTVVRWTVWPGVTPQLRAPCVDSTARLASSAPRPLTSLVRPPPCTPAAPCRAETAPAQHKRSSISLSRGQGGLWNLHPLGTENIGDPSPSPSARIIIHLPPSPSQPLLAPFPPLWGTPVLSRPLPQLLGVPRTNPTPPLPVKSAQTLGPPTAFPPPLLHRPATAIKIGHWVRPPLELGIPIPRLALSPTHCRPPQSAPTPHLAAALNPTPHKAASPHRSVPLLPQAQTATLPQTSPPQSLCMSTALQWGTRPTGVTPP